MKNAIKISGMVVLICMLSFSLLSVKPNGKSVELSNIIALALADDEGGQNEATCYSTYSPGPDYNIWRCGSCIEVWADEFQDSGTCYFK